MRCDRTVSGSGPLATAVGQALTLAFTPRVSLWLERILVSGDPGATLLTGMTGECPLFVDPLDASTLVPTVYHGPTFDGVYVQAGVPVTVQYLAGSTVAPLHLTLTGRDRP